MQRKFADEAKRDAIINLEEARVSHRKIIMTLKTGVMEKGFDSAVQAVRSCCWGQGITVAAVPVWEAVGEKCPGQEKTRDTDHKTVTRPWCYPTREESNAMSLG